MFAVHPRSSRLGARLPWLALLFLLGSAFAFPALADEDTGDLVAADFFDVVDVQIVNVEVVVTDNKGNPVSGLTLDDFQLFEDGEPVEITNFFASENVAGNDTGETVSAIERDEVAVELAPIPVEQQLEMVIFIDNENISPQNRNRVLEALESSVLNSLRPSDRVTLVSYDGSVNVKQAPTNDPTALAEVLAEMTQGSARGTQTDLDRRSILRELQRAVGQTQRGGGTQGFQPDRVNFEANLSEIRTFAEREYNRVILTTRVLGAFVDTLSGLEGRKAMIYVSDGLSLRPGEALFQTFAQLLRDTPAGVDTPFNAESESRQYDATKEFEDLGKRANASRVTFYTVMATGGRSRSLTPAERSAFVDMNAGASSMGQVWNETLDEIETSNYRASLEILADSTGGRSTVSTRDFAGALERVQEDLRTYYSLGYETQSNDGKSHRLKVKTKDDSLNVRHRETFRHLSVEERMSVRTQAALLFGSTENPLGVRVDFGPAKEAEKGQFLVPVIVKFPLSQVVLTPGESAHQGKVTLYVGARDEDGGLSPVQTMPAPIHIPNDKVLTALGQVAGYRMMLLIGPGAHEVAVTVRDELAQIESSTMVSYTAELAPAGSPESEPTESP